MYFVVVGMPEPVLVWTEDQDIKEADRVLSNIIMSYENDFAIARKQLCVITLAYISSIVLFTNGSAAPIAGANSPCLPS